MAIAKVILNGNTLIDTTDKTVTSSTLVSPNTALSADGTTVTGALITKSASDVILSGATTTIPAGVYSSQVQKTVSSGSAATPATTITVAPTISVNSNGLITASNSGGSIITPTISTGYVSSGTAGVITVNGSNTSQLASQAASTWTPTTTSQIISSGTYLTGDQTILGDSNLLASNIASGVSIFGVTGTFQGGGDLESITIKPENCASSSTQITPETYICETDSSYPGTVISMSNSAYCDIGGYLNNNIKIELNKTYHCVGQLFIKWDDDDTEEYYYIDSDFTTGSQYTSFSLSFTWEGNSGATQTFEHIALVISEGYKTKMRPTRDQKVTKSGVLLPGSFYRITQVDIDGYDTINLDFNSDPRFYGIYQSLAYRSVITSSAQYVSEWCNSLSSIKSYQFNGVVFYGTFNFNNTSIISNYAFAEPDAGQGMVGGDFIFNFPSLIDLSFAAFYYNKGIRGFYANQLSVIGAKAFNSCINLNTISFPECTIIKNDAFYRCYSLTVASFPKCISISAYAFYSCSGLTTISFPNCVNINNNAFQSCYNLTNASFPECTSIGGYAFQSCYNLTNASFPECTSIGSYAFMQCSNLTTVSFPKCTTISNYAFQSCNSLATISFSKCTIIGNYAFSSCGILNTISFPECTSIGTGAFQRCISLTTISFPECTSIGQAAFQYCSSLTTISFPECTTISNFAFQYCSSLTTISFPKCTTIGSSVFMSCKMLATVSFSECTSIGSNAFYGCSSLSAAYFIGSSIVTLGPSVFTNTPMANSTYLGYFGSIYVPSSLLTSYKTATNWATYSARMVGV